MAHHASPEGLYDLTAGRWQEPHAHPPPFLLKGLVIVHQVNSSRVWPDPYDHLGGSIGYVTFKLIGEALRRQHQLYPTESVLP